ILSTRLASHPHEFSVTASEAIFPGANIVFETSAHSIAIHLQDPAHYFHLMTSDPGCRPSRIRKYALELAVQKIEDPSFRRECTLYSHDELNVRMITDQSEVYEFPRAINVRKVEHF